MGKLPLALGRTVVFLACLTALLASGPLHLHLSLVAKVFLAVGAVTSAILLLDG